MKIILTEEQMAKFYPKSPQESENTINHLFISLDWQFFIFKTNYNLYYLVLKKT